MCEFTTHGIPEVRFPFHPGQLLEVLGYRRAETGPDKGTFPASAWRCLRHSLARIGALEMDFDLAVVERSDRGRSRRVDDTFQGSLLDGDEGHILLRCYPPPCSTYFVLLPARIFSLRSKLDDTAARLLLWLYYRHRGRKPKGAPIQHRLEVELARSVLIDLFLIDPRREAEGWRRMNKALTKLADLGVLRLRMGTIPTVSFDTEFFYRGGKDA
jgi:hypothetical protein